MRYLKTLEPLMVDGEMRPAGYVFRIGDHDKAPVRHRQVAHHAEEVALTEDATEAEWDEQQAALAPDPELAVEPAPGTPHTDQQRPAGVRIRLHTDVPGLGHAGEVVTVADVSQGPHRAVRQAQDAIDYSPANGLDANHVPGAMVDEPLFDVVPDDEPAGTVDPNAAEVVTD